MSLPLITSTSIKGLVRSHAYGSDDPAILVADLGLSSQYIVCSKRLATDIYADNIDYSASELKQGLKDGWLILVINPTLYESLTNPIRAIRAIKSDATMDGGWYKLMIIPEWGSRRRR